MITNLVLQKDHLLMEKVMTFLSFKSLGIPHLHTQLHALKCHILPHLKLPRNKSPMNLIFIRNILFKMLTSSNRQELHSGACMNHRSNVKSTHLLLSISQRSSMIQGLRPIIHLHILFLLILEIILKKIYHLN